jgi:hypothetical protein
MVRPPRCDGAGVWHHVMNRGIAKRTVFESRRDIRYFLSRVARAVRSGWIEVHSYSVLTTHFHMLVRSKDGGLSQAMCRVLDEYVRWFNRSRKRDGPLFRGRFRSRPVDTLEYRRRLVQYIDANPVQANLAPASGLYPHGSAWWYMRLRGPRWLDRSWIEQDVRDYGRHPTFDPGRYAALFGGPMPDGLARVIERRIESGVRAHDPLDDLIGAAPERVLEWMRHKAAVADGTSIDLPICDPEDVCELVAAEFRDRPDGQPSVRQGNRSARTLLEIALLRDLCGCPFRQIGARSRMSDARVARAYRAHAEMLAEVEEYSSAATRLACQAIEQCFGARSPLHAQADDSGVRTEDVLVAGGDADSSRRWR